MRGGLKELVQSPRGGLERCVGCRLAVSLDVRGVPRGKQRDGGGMHVESCLKQKSGEVLGAAEIDAGLVGPSGKPLRLREESIVLRLRASQCAVMDVKSRREIDGSGRRRPFVLDHGTEGRKGGEQGREPLRAAGDTEAPYLATAGGVLKHTEQSVATRPFEVGRLDLMEQPQIDALAAHHAEAVLKREEACGRGEREALPPVDAGGCLGEASARRRESAHQRADQAAGKMR